MTGFFETLVTASWQAAVIAAIVGFVCLTFRKWLTPTVRYVLWLLVVLRLVSPYFPESPVSVFNVFPNETSMALLDAIEDPVKSEEPVAETAPRVEITPAETITMETPAEKEFVVDTLPLGVDMSADAELPRVLEPLPAVSATAGYNWPLIIWCAGMAVLLLRLLVGWISLQRILLRSTEIREGFIVEVLRSYRWKFRIKRRVRLLESPDIKGPALYGVFRPRLIVPSGAVKSFSTSEWEMVFAHELAHVARWDNAVNWLTTVLQIVHWFNPVVWAAFWQLRNEREMATDELALSVAGETRVADYGETILKMLENLRKPWALPGSVGILEDGGRIQQRIRLISIFQSRSRWSVFALVMGVVLSVLCLTNPKLLAEIETIADQVDDALFSPAQPGAEGLTIDLSPYYTRRFDAEDYQGVGKELPDLDPNFDGLRFQLNGRVSVWGGMRAARGHDVPVAVRGVPVNAKFDELHLVHHGEWTEVDGRVIARVRLNYAHGASHDFPIEWGRHVRHWFYLPTHEHLNLSDPNAKLFWIDPSRDRNRFMAFRVLWKTHFMNPHPDELVESMDIISNGESGTYSLVSAVAAKTDRSRKKSPGLDLETAPRNFTGRVTIMVKSENTGEPLPNATIRTSAQTKGIHLFARDLVTDENGEAVFRYWKEETSLVTFTAMADGHQVARRVLRGDIDPQATILLPKGETVGGMVVDGKGYPIPGATVTLGQAATFTDARGRWLLDGQSPGPLQFPLHVRPQGQSLRKFQIGRELATAELRSKTAKIVIKYGGKLTGIVRDEDGNPLADARVFYGTSISDEAGSEVRTDADGRFKFADIPQGSSYLTVRKEDFFPRVFNVSVGAEDKLLEVDLKPGREISGFVRDKDGNPMKGVRITGYPTKGPSTYFVRAWTKEDGRFHFAGVSDQPMRFTFDRRTLRPHSAILAPNSNDKEHEVIVGEVNSLRGRVFDAETKQPIPNFTVRVGHLTNDDLHFHDRTRSFLYGVFDVNLGDLPNNSQGAFRVDAKGYLPVFSKAFSVNEPPADFQIAMWKAIVPEGRVLLPDGQPAAHAQVTINTAKRKTKLRGRDLKHYNRPDYPVVETDEKGGFRMLPYPASTEIIVSHEKGFGHARLAGLSAEAPIKLQAWGSVAGQLTRGGQPAANEYVTLRYVAGREGPLNLPLSEYMRRTDEFGQVEWQHLPAGEYRMIRLIRGGTTAKRTYTLADERAVAVASGEKAFADLDVGIQFRSVSGQVMIPNHAEADLSLVKVKLRRVMMMKPIGDKQLQGPKPSDAEQARQGYVFPEFELYANADGSFALAGVPTGAYVMRAVPDSEELELAELSQGILIQPGDNDATVDLGEFEMQLASRK